MGIIFIRYLERWSLDAVLVAVVWGLALEQLAAREMDLWAVAVLALATWLTYVADRLWDVRPGRTVPQTDRHLYYKRNYKVLLSLWAAVFFCSVILSVLVLPLWKWGGGWILVSVVAAYLFLLARDWNAFIRLFVKRTAVPVIFTCGVVWISECWRVPEGWAALCILLFGATANVLIISYWESHDTSRPAWLKPACWISVAGLCISSAATLLLHLHLGGAAMFSAVAYAILLRTIHPRSSLPVRALVDAILAVSGILLLLAR